jgi:hypothetical protein
MNQTIRTRWPICAAVLVAAVGLAAGNAPAYAARMEWRAGPLGLAAGQSAQVGIGNLEIFPCSIGVQIRAFSTQLLANTISNPDHVPAGGGLVVSTGNPHLISVPASAGNWWLGCEPIARPARWLGCGGCW